MSITPKQSDWSPKYTELRDANGMLQQRTVQHTPDGPIEILYPPQEKEQYCFCGDIYNLGVIHRDDGPCHYPDHKEPEQEPVALEAVYETIIQWDEGGGKRSRRELARRIVSLYNTPPQRKPLTYVDLRRIASQCGLGANEVSAQAQAKVDNFARAIEAAHGIGVEK